MSLLRRHFPSLLQILALAALGAGLCALVLPAEQRAVADQLIGFPDSDALAHQVRPFILVALCALPVLARLVYGLGSTLDRYLTRQFLGIFGICLAALFMIWLLIDLSDKITDFRKTNSVLHTMAVFYATRSTTVFLLLLPYSLLLALLYSLGKLSTDREVIAMIQSGRGLFRLSLPLFIAGAFCTAFSLGLNYHWAPIAEGQKDEILAEASGREATEATQVLYNSPEHRRLWMIGAFPPDYQKGRPLRHIEVTTTTPDHHLLSRLTATEAQWDRETRQWTFQHPVISRYRPGQPPQFLAPDGPLVIDSWPETPWQLIKPGLSAAYLGIPDLNTWLKTNALHHEFADPAPYLTQWHYRWAQPFACLVTVLLAAPLAIHFARRGAGGGLFFAIALSAIMMLVSNIVLAMGESGTIPPALAAWLPNLVFATLGLYLFYRRISGRPIYHTLRKLLPADDDN